MSDVQLSHTALGKLTTLSKYCRKSGLHGGTAVFGENNGYIKAIDEVSRMSIDFACECCGIGLKVNSRKVAILVIYRSPDSSVNVFLDALNEILVFTSRKYQDIILCGDLNIDWCSVSSDRKLLADLFESFSLVSILPPNEHTRVSKFNGTAIDYCVCRTWKQ